MDLKRFKAWMYREGYSVGTQGNTIRYLKRVTVDLDIVEEYEIVDFLQQLSKRGTSINNFVKSINRYLKFRGIEYRFKKKPIKGDLDIWIPTEEEAKRLRTCEWDSKFTTTRNRLLIDILFIAGLRREEVRTLKFSDLRDTPAKTKPHTSFHYLHVIGKGEKRRFVDIPYFLYKDILYFKRFYKAGVEYIFENGDGVPISSVQVGRICREAAQKAKVKEFHAHAARHYRAVELDEEGVDLESIRRFLGHSNLSTTQLYLRGRRNKTRIELHKKDKYFKGFTEDFYNDKTAQREPSGQPTDQIPTNPKHERMDPEGFEP